MGVGGRLPCVREERGRKQIFLLITDLKEVAISYFHTLLEEVNLSEEESWGLCIFFFLKRF